MTEAKQVAHTAGPWVAHHGWAGDGPCKKHPDWCEVTGGSFEDGSHLSINGHFGMANARLIAAAPDLLEAVRGFLLGCSSEKALAEIVGEDVIRDARAALSKAGAA